MIMKKMYVVHETYYDYFMYNNRYGGESKKFDTLLEAWEYYKSHKASDYDYNDSFRTTYTPTCIWFAEKPIHKNHGQRFGHEPTVEEKLRKAVDNAIVAWKKANDAYQLAYADFCHLAREEGYLAAETLDAEEYAQRLHCIADSLWARVEEAEANRDKHYGIVKQYDDAIEIKDDFDNYNFDDDIFEF